MSTGVRSVGAADRARLREVVPGELGLGWGTGGCKRRGLGGKAEPGEPAGAVLEGGYDLDGLGGGMTAVLSALAGPAAPLPAIAPLPAHMVARAAIEGTLARTATRVRRSLTPRPRASTQRQARTPCAEIRTHPQGLRILDRAHGSAAARVLIFDIAMAIKRELGSEPTQVDAIHALRS